MPVKNLRYRDREIETLWNHGERNLLRHGSAAQDSRITVEPNSLEARFEENLLMPTTWEPLVKDEFEIALVPRKCTPPHRPSADRILLLSLTWRELLERVRTVFERSKAENPAMVLAFGEVYVDFLTMEVRRAGKAVSLTAQGFKLLRFFSQRPQQVITRDELLNEVWGYTHYPSTRTVDNHVCTLRKKLEVNPGQPIHFLTVHGMGYKFVP